MAEKNRQELIGELVRLMATDRYSSYPEMDLAKEADQETIQFYIDRMVKAGDLLGIKDLVAYRQGAAPAFTQVELDLAVGVALDSGNYYDCRGYAEFFEEIGLWPGSAIIDRLIRATLERGEIGSAQIYAQRRKDRPSLTSAEITKAINSRVLVGDVHGAKEIAASYRTNAPALYQIEYNALADAIIKSGNICHINSVFKHVSPARLDEAINVAVGSGYDVHNLKCLIALYQNPPRLTQDCWSRMVAAAQKGWALRYLLRDMLDEGGVDEEIVCSCIRKMVQAGKDFHLRDEVGENQAYYDRMTLKMKDCYVDANIDRGNLYEAVEYAGYGCLPATVDKLIKACIEAGDAERALRAVAHRQSAPQLSDDELNQLIVAYRVYLKTRPEPVEEDDFEDEYDDDD